MQSPSVKLGKTYPLPFSIVIYFETLFPEDSNVALVGSAQDMEARKNAAQTEANWKGAGEIPGLQIWRVENVRNKHDVPVFGVKPWPKEEYGSFFSGDSYIVLNTFLDESSKSKKLLHDIHFWIGSASTQVFLIFERSFCQ